MNTTRLLPRSPDTSHPTDTAHRTGAPADRLADTALGRDRGILMDLLGVLPAPTLSRELFALVVNLAAVGVLIAVLQPAALVTAVIVGVVAAMVLGRLIAGFLVRGYLETLRGGR